MPFAQTAVRRLRRAAAALKSDPPPKKKKAARAPEKAAAKKQAAAKKAAAEAAAPSGPRTRLRQGEAGAVTKSGQPVVNDSMLPSTSAPGSRVLTSRFFDDYPRFFETSTTTAFPSRLNLRHEAIFGENSDLFEGKRVLDIASHDGRWSFAALKAGAASVIGIEGRPELVDYSNQTFDEYGMDKERYRFIAGDIYKVLADETFEVDVVLCLGFLYHTLRWNELMMRIRQAQPKHVLIDTAITDGKRALIQMKVEQVHIQGNAVFDEFTHGDSVLSGKPTRRGLEVLVGAFGYDVEKWSDWAGLVRDNPEHAEEFRSYVNGYRVTARCKARD